MCLGYEELNDNEDLRRDLILAAMVGKKDLEGKNRHQSWYCARGDMENRIKEQELHLFAVQNI